MEGRSAHACSLFPSSLIEDASTEWTTVPATSALGSTKIANVASHKAFTKAWAIGRFLGPPGSLWTWDDCHSLETKWGTRYAHEQFASICAMLLNLKTIVWTQSAALPMYLRYLRQKEPCLSTWSKQSPTWQSMAIYLRDLKVMLQHYLHLSTIFLWFFSTCFQWHSWAQLWLSSK
jgi:hypothetical protein